MATAPSFNAPQAPSFSAPGSPNLDNGYQYTPLDPNISKPWQQANNGLNQDATQGVSSIKDKINSGMDQSNLMGPSNPSNPEDDALSQRAQQYYQSNLSQMTRNSASKAQDLSSGMQTKAISDQSAIYSNQQSIATINYKNALFQRQAAIEMAQYKRQLYSNLFGAGAQIMGTGLALATGADSGGGGGSPLTGLGLGLGSLFGGGGGKDSYWGNQMGGPPEVGGDSGFQPTEPGWNLGGEWSGGGGGGGNSWSL